MISIIIPIYNAEKYIDRCISSLNNQTCKDFEAIFVDDGSVDRSGEISDNYAEKDARFKVIHKNNSGPGPSRNAGIAEAKGEYILFVDSDDYIRCDTIEILDRVTKNENYPDAVIFDYVMTNGERNINRSSISYFEEGGISVKDAILCSVGSTWCKLYKTDIILKNAVSFPSLMRKEDFVFNKTALSYCKNIFYKKENLYFYYNNENSIMHTTSYSEDIQKSAFDNLSRNISYNYAELVDMLKINNYLISAVQNMLLKKVSFAEIKKFLYEYENDSPNWYKVSSEMRLSREKRLYLRLINKKHIFTLKILFIIKERLKQYL